MNKTYLDTMADHYIIAALWSSTMDNGDPFDDHFSLHQIDPESLERVKNDCRNFINDTFELLENWNPEQAGHDFWLSRNGHGAGFFDRTTIADQLTCDALQDACRKYGELYCFTNDDDGSFGIE